MNNFLYDTHSHLDLVKDLDSLVSEIEKRKIYTIGVTNLPPLYKKLNDRLKSKYIKPALGFHPELIKQYQKYIPEMWELLTDAKYIGEVGLDFKVSLESKLIQINFFEELIKRCNELGGKILTIHSRGSAEDIVSIIGENFNSKYILHWYSGNLKTLNNALNNGAYFSINYSMTNTISGQKIIANIPNEKLLLESDAPFVKYNGNRNFSTLDIDIIVKKLSEIKKIEYQDMRSILCNNFKNLLVDV
ncbi:TatD family hydrolase [Amniculibacterium aquaticum]|uniref:TatD family hydrolase n=1 Tax=Amniculibacterium aquaticum TaxID=2479858 RepID=UPI000F5A5F2B|nr:TatD family hydrolase [Amniculibacterium aquaticum]